MGSQDEEKDEVWVQDYDEIYGPRQPFLCLRAH